MGVLARHIGTLAALLGLLQACADPLEASAPYDTAAGALGVLGPAAPDVESFGLLPGLRLRERIVAVRRDGLLVNRCPVVGFSCYDEDDRSVDGALLPTFGAVRCFADGSLDPDGDALTYKWSVEAPLGDGADTSLTPSESAAQFDVTPLLHGAYRVQLDVTDGRCLNSAPAVEFDAASAAELVVELTWDSVVIESNLDLHVTRQSGCWGNPSESSSAESPQPGWGDSGTADDPWLRRADADVRGAEVFELGKLEPNVRYDVGVESFVPAGSAGATVHVRVFAGGEMVVDERRSTLNPGWFWNVASVDATEQVALIENRVDVSRAAANRARGLVCGQ